ncbi:PRD domain-containing protein [Enterococcus hulanensis]|uniref:PRD domain-containing protein n=1 Tax=Enterococcus hulanensis TaxID=2559929 RepID=UPI00288DE7FE|nr:PRD domain-containing protein [Enterococcus hulanensis]MDT2661008.1 PRD domain-containing protein [Enterococcus hulanensis]
MYKVIKRLNNNVALVENKAGGHFLAFGKGLVYDKKEGQLISEERVEKSFFLAQGDFSQIADSLSNISPEIFSLSREISDIAKKKLKTDFDGNLLLMLADHINFAIERTKRGIELANPMKYEIKRLYKEEMAIGIEALRLVEEQLACSLPEDEASMIAMHLVNSQVKGHSMDESVMITKMTSEVLNIINFHFQIILDESSFEVTRFLIHLRDFILRYLHDEKPISVVDKNLFDYVINNYEETYQCVKKIERYFYGKQQMLITQNEAAYLVLHIQRLIQK